MFQFRKYILPLVLAGLVAARVAVALTAQEPKPAPSTKDTKAIDLAGLHDAISAASKRGENVDEISKALAAFEKVAPAVKQGSVPPELQALRDAVDSAARKGENVVDIAKELTAVEKAVTGHSLVKPRPAPKPQPLPNDPFQNFNPPPLPNFQFPQLPNAAPLAGGIDVELFNKAMELRRKALDMIVKNPNDPEVRKEARKLQAEASEMLMKAVRKMGGGMAPIAPIPPFFPDNGRILNRPRLGISMERVTDLAAAQLGLEPNAGIAVSTVMPGSAAEKAGLKVHDIILEFAGKPVSDSMEDFVQRVNDVKTGEKVNIVVLRKGKKVEVKGVELPEVAKQPVRPVLPGAGDIPNLPINPRAITPRLTVVAPPGFSNLNYTRKNEEFELTAMKGDNKYVITGIFDKVGKVNFGSATIESAGKKRTANTLDQLTGDDRTNVEKLLKAFSVRD